MLSRSIRKIQNLFMLPLTFQNWGEAMRELILTYAPFADNKRTLITHTRKGPKLRIRLHNTLDIGSILEVYQRDVYFPSFLRVPDNPVVFDIGASIGDFSVFCATQFNNARVFSFEPTPGAFKVLNENIALNGLESKITPCNVGVSGTKSQFTIAGETFDSITLKDIFDEYNLTKCDLLKMDTEGMEYDIFLNTSIETLKMINAIVMECHISGGTDNLVKLKNHLSDAKMNVTTTDITEHDICYLYAVRT